jgi:hypothetical protein
MLRTGVLVPADPDPRFANVQADDASAHLRSAERVATADPTGAADLVWESIRKATAAHAIMNGLRFKSRPGFHAAHVDYAAAGLDLPTGIDHDRIDAWRIERGGGNYRAERSTPQEVLDDLPAARQIVLSVRRELGLEDYLARGNRPGRGVQAG